MRSPCGAKRARRPRTAEDTIPLAERKRGSGCRAELLRVRDEALHRYHAEEVVEVKERGVRDGDEGPWPRAFPERDVALEDLASDRAGAKSRHALGELEDPARALCKIAQASHGPGL
jgi:hypothetical protein